MPPNVVRTPEDEAAWTAAKKRVREQYPNIEEGDERFYKLTMTIFQSMRGRSTAGSTTKGRLTLGTRPMTQHMGWFGRLLTAAGVLKAAGAPEQPGSRGGKGYWNDAGKWVYGDRDPGAGRRIHATKTPATGTCDRCGGRGREIHPLAETRGANVTQVFEDFPMCESCANQAMREHRAAPGYQHGYSPGLTWHRSLRKAEGPEHPGSRGGRGYYDQHGNWQYGERPTGHTAGRGRGAEATGQAKAKQPKLTPGDKAAVEFVVNRYPVHTPWEDIEREIHDRVDRGQKKNPTADPRLRALYVAHAKKIHERNRQQYADVVGGRVRKAAGDDETVQHPGSRGGRFYYDEGGQVRYGEKPTPHLDAAGVAATKPVHEVASNPELKRALQHWYGGHKGPEAAAKDDVAAQHAAAKQHFASADSPKEHAHVPHGRPHIIGRQTVGGSEFEFAIRPKEVDGKKTGKFHAEVRYSHGHGPQEWESAYEGVHPTYDAAAQAFGRRHGDKPDMQLHDPVAIHGAHQADEERARHEEAQEQERSRVAAEQEAAAERRTAIDAAVRGIKWKQATITVPLAGAKGQPDTTQDVKGPSYGGLIIQKVDKAAYGVTHMASGKFVARDFPSQQAAKVAAYRLAALTDWTKDEKTVLGSVDGKKMSAAINQLRRDEYADLEPEAPRKTTAKAITLVSRAPLGRVICAGGRLLLKASAAAPGPPPEDIYLEGREGRRYLVKALAGGGRWEWDVRLLRKAAGDAKRAGDAKTATLAERLAVAVEEDDAENAA